MVKHDSNIFLQYWGQLGQHSDGYYWCAEIGVRLFSVVLQLRAEFISNMLLLVYLTFTLYYIHIISKPTHPSIFLKASTGMKYLVPKYSRTEMKLSTK